MAEALQDLISKNAKNNEVEDTESIDQDPKGEQDDQGTDADTVKPQRAIGSIDSQVSRVVSV